ncbi:MAG: serine/threonine protein kinase [Acidobacteria bacterium]|nr:MAG: serine/threonine protein kinase [Acidobacteriota bacterium]
MVSELGRGAMGVVYKARDPKIDRFVAVKTVSLVGHVPEEKEEYRERFFREAQAAGRLLHPGIVTIFDVGEDADGDGPYIVMEYVAGVSLNGMLSEGAPIPLESALRLTQQIAEALDCAHAQGIVHRDIKPANIMVTANGQAKITDFGIAKLNLTHLTLPGHVFGTPAYMSPEQIEGGSVDGRADIFALGVILYSMVTGYRPFQGNSVMTVCFKVANREPLAPTLLDPNLPRELDAVLARAMAKNRTDRYQRGMEMAMDLRELIEGRGPASGVGGGLPASKDPTRGLDAEHRFASALWSRAKNLSAKKALLTCLGAAVLTLGLRLASDSSAHSPSRGAHLLPPPPVDAIAARGAVPEASPVDGATFQPTSVRRAMLDLEVQHSFKDGKISVWMDGKLQSAGAALAEALCKCRRAPGRSSSAIG